MRGRPPFRDRTGREEAPARIEHQDAAQECRSAKVGSIGKSFGTRLVMPHRDARVARRTPVTPPVSLAEPSLTVNKEFA